MKSEKGFSLAEVMVAIALLGVFSVAFLGALTTASRAVFIADERASGESLARTEMEYIRSQQYAGAPWEYELPLPPGWPEDLPPLCWDPDNPHTLPEGYDGYTVTVSAEGLIDPGIDNCIQRITVVVSHMGAEGVRLEGYRAMP